MFSFGRTSTTNLVSVHPDLVRVALHAIELSTQDFGCTCGVRSDEDQLHAWQLGHSKLNGIPIGQSVDGIAGTGRGNHQISLTDNLGHAVDLVPFVNGVILWSAVPPAQQWSYIYPVAESMRAAAVLEKVNLRWGGVWDRVLNSLAPGAAALEAELKAYEVRHAGVDFIDGPHFELHP